MKRIYLLLALSFPTFAQPTITASVTTSPVLAGASVALSRTCATCVSQSWQQISGPPDAPKLVWSSRTSATPSVSRVVAGSYTVRVTGTDSGGLQSSVNVSFSAEFRGTDGKPIYPTNLDVLPAIPFRFSLNTLPGATGVQITVMPSDGRKIISPVFTSSPAQVRVDPRFGQHYYRAEYITPTFRRRTEWIPFTAGSSTVTTGTGTEWKTKAAFWNYGAVYSDEQARFLYPKMWMMVADPSTPVVPYNAAAKHPTYKDYVYETAVYGGALEGVHAIHQYAHTNSIDPEEIFVHTRTDFTHPNGWNATVCLDYQKFGWMEGGKGVLTTSNDSEFTDVTDAAGDYSGGCSGGTTTFTLANKMYVASSLPYHQINFDVTTGRSGGSVSYEYWNGSAFAALTTSSDTSNGLTQDGILTFVVPSGWTTRSVDGSSLRYVVRVTVTGATTSPVFQRVHNYTTIGGTSNFRPGFNPADSGVLLSGTKLRYNPNPPTGSSAYFPWQSRFGGIWTNAGQFYNHANGTYARNWLIYWYQQQHNLGWSGVMWDDGGGAPCEGNPCPGIDWAAEIGIASHEQWYEALSADHEAIRNAFPDDLIGANTTAWGFVQHLRLGVREGFGYGNQRSESFPMEGLPSGEISLATMRTPAEGGTNTAGIYAMWKMSDLEIVRDSSYGPQNDGTNDSGQYIYYDRSNRGPIMALAIFKLGGSTHNLFNYGRFGTTYDKGDHVWIYRAQTGKLTSATAPGDTVLNGDFANAPSGTYVVSLKYGDLVEDFEITKTNDTTLTRGPNDDVIHSVFPVGTEVRYVEMTNLSTVRPRENQVHTYNVWFPAVAFDIGAPTSSPNYNFMTVGEASAGRRTVLGDEFGGRVWKGTFEKADIYVRTSGRSTPAVDYAEYSIPISLGGTRYPLHADGTVGAGVTSIQLRYGEAVIGCITSTCQ